MKKAKHSRVGTILRAIFNIRWWIDYDRLKSFSLYLASGFKKMFIPHRTEATETFQTAMSELNLTESELIAKQKGLFRLSMLMCVVALFMLGYTGYQIYYGSWRAMIISLVVMLIALVLAFRYHFWYFQIKRRKLGCSFREWYRQGLLGEKHE